MPARCRAGADNHLMARYDQIADFYIGVVGDDVTDPATAALIELAGSVRGRRVLDLACGHGRVTRELARRGGRLVGLDSSADLLRAARGAEAADPFGIEYRLANAADFEALTGETFDVVVCNFGLSDIDDLSGVIGTVERVLRPGGSFVWSVLHPCFPGWDADAPSSWGPNGYFDEGWWLAGNPGFRGRVGANHRMLSTYLNEMIGHGLVIERTVEPLPDEGWADRWPEGVPVPVYLVVRCQRPIVTGAA